MNQRQQRVSSKDFYTVALRRSCLARKLSVYEGRRELVFKDIKVSLGESLQKTGQRIEIWED